MFYARTSEITARFYSRADRDQFCEEMGAEPIRARAAKFVPGADKCITYSSKSPRYGWVRI